MKSILSKLWLGITSLVLIIILLLWVFQVGLLKQFYINERKSSLLKEGNKLSSIFLEDNKTVSEALKSEIDSFTTSINSKVFIYDDSNDLLFTNIPIRKDKIKNIRMPNFDLSETNKPFDSETLIISKNISHFHTPEILVKVPIIYKNSIIGNIILTSPLAPIEEAIFILKKQLSIISFLSIIIATALALAFSRYFTRPILNITDASRKIARGDFTTSVDVNSKDELGILGETINDMSDQLGKTETLRKEFIANISHELKTPISLIKAYSEVLKDIDIDKDSKNEYLDIITDESNRLNRMVEDILYLSKIEAGFSKPIPTEFPIFPLVENVIEKLELLIKEKKIELIINIDFKDTKIYADKNKMYQVLYNLINNSITHSYENGKIIIKIINLEASVSIEISDRGQGISKENLPYIWDRFYKVDKSRKRDNGGTGLGMSIVKNILDAHGFDYGIKSTINEGTTVWINIRRV